MTGPEHYRKAERLTRQAEGLDPEGALIAAQLATAHATLALAAATAGNTSVLAFAHDINDSDVDAWHAAAGTKAAPRGDAG